MTARAGAAGEVGQDERRVPIWIIVLWCALLFAVWTLREVFIKQPVLAALGPLGAALAGGVFKLLVWTLPALLLARRYRQCLAVPRLFGAPVRWGVTAACCAALMAFSVVSSWFTMGFGLPRLHPAFDPISLIGTVLLVGITEEAAFRGWLLNALVPRIGETTALIISSALFVLIHFPIWYTNGLFLTPFTLLRSCLSIFMLGMLFGYSFLREKNLLPPILMHMAWNLGVLLIFGS